MRRLPLTSTTAGLYSSAAGLVVSAGLYLGRPTLLGPSGHAIAATAAIAFFVSLVAFALLSAIEDLREQIASLSETLADTDTLSRKVRTLRQELEAVLGPPPADQVWDLTPRPSRSINEPLSSGMRHDERR